jgi:hypothetical protein
LKAASLFCLRSNLHRVGGRYTVGPFSNKSPIKKKKGLPHCRSILVLLISVWFWVISYHGALDNPMKTISDDEIQALLFRILKINSLFHF